MKAQKSLFSFFIDSIRNDQKTGLVLFSIFGIVLFTYYAIKSARLFLENVAGFPDGLTIAYATTFALLLLGIYLAAHTLIKDTGKVIKSIKSKYHWYLYIWYADEVLKFYKIKSDLLDKINSLLKIRTEESLIAFNMHMSESWRKQDSHIQWLFQEEKYEELAMLKRADDIRIEFERTNDFELLRNSSEAAKDEITKLQNQVEEVDKIILKLEENESLINRKLNLK